MYMKYKTVYSTCANSYEQIACNKIRCNQTNQRLGKVTVSIGHTSLIYSFQEYTKLFGVSV